MPGPDDVLIASSLFAATEAPSSGSTTALAILMEPQGEWHGYWKQPGDVGLPATFTWHLPDGVMVSDPAYPLPRTLLIEGLMNHVYEHPYALLVELTLDGDLPGGTALPIRVDMQYLACRYDACVPERASLETTLHVGDGHQSPDVAARFANWRQALPRPLAAQASFDVEGDLLRLRVPLPASVPIQNPHLFSATKGAIDDAAPQHFERRGDDLFIETRIRDEISDAFLATLKLSDNLGLDIDARRGGSASAPASTSESSLSITLIALAGAIAGGLLLNLMPCVFPILSLKAMSLARSGTSPAIARRDAVAYTSGVVLVCVLMGILLLVLRAGGAQVGWAFQLQNAGVILTLMLLTTAIAFNLAGLFELASIDAGTKLTSRSGAAGAFWTGALAAFIATPCSGPFMAAALGAALVLPTAAALLVFAGLGLGIALPFLLIGFIPALQRRLPRPGPWMATLRRLLAVPMFLTALALLWVLSHQVPANALVSSLGCAMLLALGLWLTGLRQQKLKRNAWLPASLALILALGLGWGQVSGQTAPASDVQRRVFNEQQLAQLRADKVPVFLYFTADWCIICKVNEQVAINRDATAQAFAAAGVVVMRGDWTNGDPVITAFLERHGRSGVPLYLWYGAGEPEPRLLPQILGPGSLLELVQR
ncbi:protein-disulfide reductase DsbD [Pseudomonas sp. IC_126]|uniref:protein-disulfide reductase DsbD family protein n=1 Tax=Pseudomonas sp. IC_126 TaxID=2547400 RepID=UPI001C49B336|nr:thioredoxin family protein [Pseudomonas sp. IC_126]